MNLDLTKSTIFFVHRRGFPRYLMAAMLQARLSDKNSNIVLLSDSPRSVPRFFGEQFFLVDLNDYTNHADDFGIIYRHDGRNPREYTLGNFQRWFLIQSFTEVHRLTQEIMHLDSDAFLYSSVAELSETISSSFTVVDRVGPQFAWFRNPTALGEFTRFLTDSFQSDYKYKRLKQFVEESADFGLPHVSDMAAIGLHGKLSGAEDIGDSSRGDFVFCENLGSLQGLSAGFLGKKIRWKHGRRYFVKKDKSLVLAGGIHLQGGNKDYWPFFVDFSVARQMQFESGGYWNGFARASAKLLAFTLRTRFKRLRLTINNLRKITKARTP